MYKYLNLLLAFLLIGYVTFAQQNSSSPFSYYGIGDINSKGVALNKSMSGLGIGVNSSYYLNGINPAGLCAMDTMSFTFEVGTSAQISQIRSGDILEKSTNGNIDYMAVGFPIAKWMKVSVGFNPFSSVGYNLKSYQFNEDKSIEIERSIIGEGGISQVYFDNSITILKKISLGVHLGYYFGNITNVISDQSTTNDVSLSKFVDSTETIYKDWYTSFGLQYTDKINNSYRFIIGGIVGLEQNINNKYSHAQRSISVGHNRDDIILKKDKDIEGFVKIPMFYGFGLSVSNEKITYALDYRFSGWSSVAKAGQFEQYYDENKLVAGIQYLPKPRTATKYYQRVRYRISGLYQTHYLGVFNEQVKELGINFGVALPMKRSKSTLNISVDLGKRGTINSETLNLSYIKFNLDLSMHDIWFMKRKYD